MAWHFFGVVLLWVKKLKKVMRPRQVTDYTILFHQYSFTKGTSTLRHERIGKQTFFLSLQLGSL